VRLTAAGFDPLAGASAASLVAAAAVCAVVLLRWRAPPVALPGPRATPRWLPWSVGGVALVVVPPRWAAPLLVLGGAALAGRALWRRRAEARAAEETARRMLEACEVVAAELAAGRTGGAALDEAAATWPALRPVADASRLGGDVPGALRELARAPGADGLRLLAGAWVVSHRTGAGLAASTRRVADAVRRDQAMRRVVRGELASARATARLVAGLPVVALLMGSGAGGDPWTFLLGTPLGLACLASGLTIGLVGLWWIELIAREVDR
jgi:tight adherence protein B